MVSVGKNLLVSSTNGVLRVVDAFSGQIIQTFTVSTAINITVLKVTKLVNGYK